MQCETDKATIDYREYGQGRPIVFLHGWTMDRRVEVDTYEKIFSGRPDWRRLYPDLPGMGRSVAKPGLVNQDDILEAMLSFIDQVLPSGRFLLAGTSHGAYLARAVAAYRRPRIAGLLLRVPRVFDLDGQRTLPPFRPLVQDEDLMAGLDAATRSTLTNVLVQKRDYVEAASWRSRSVVQPAIAATQPIAMEIRSDSKRYAFSFDLAEREKTFEEPTLIIAGRQDTVVGYRDAWTLLESYPRATFAVIDRADHGWPIETPDLLAALIDDWLMRIAEREA